MGTSDFFREHHDCRGRFRTYDLTKRRALMAAGMIVCLGAAAPSGIACQLVQIAELDVTMQHDTPTVPATIEGRSVQMILNTSYARTQLSRSAANDLHLRLRSSGATHGGSDAIDAAELTTVRDFHFAGPTLHEITLYASNQSATAENVVGAIGEDVLSRSDMELDLGAGKIRFFAPANCKGEQVAYWARGYFVTGLVHTDDSPIPLVEATLNGHKVLATLNSGIPKSTITTRALQLSGINSVPRNSQESFVVVPSLSIGQEILQNERLDVADATGKSDAARFESGGHGGVAEPDLQIGGDFFLAHRIYISRGQDKVYFTYNGRMKTRTAGLLTNPST